MTGGKLLSTVMTTDQMRRVSENDNQILMLTKDQRTRIRNGENAYNIINELDPDQQQEIQQYSQDVMNSLDRQQKIDLQFLSSGLLDGIDLDKRQAILQTLKDSGGKLTFDDLVKIGVYKPEDMPTGIDYLLDSWFGMGGPVQMPGLLEQEYKLNNYDTSFAKLDAEQQEQRNAQLTMLFALTIGPLVDRALYGSGKRVPGDNGYDAVEKYGWDRDAAKRSTQRKQTKEALPKVNDTPNTPPSAPPPPPPPAPPENEGAGERINPNKIRFSQSSVNGADDITKSMKANGWQGEPIDVVKMSDGKLTSIDNTRVVSARQAGIDVHANVHEYGDPLTHDEMSRFSTKKGIPKTWGEAIELRIGKQNSTFRKNYPSGSFDLPRLN